MKKLFLALTLTAASFISAHAQVEQSQVRFGAGVNVGLPVGTFHNGWSFGVGGQIQAEYGLTDNITGVATTGYTRFFGKTLNYTGYTYDNNGNLVTYNASYKEPGIGLIPVLVGARFYPVEKVFVGAQVGLGILTGTGTSHTGFDYYPQVGYDFTPLQVVLGYNGVSDNGTLGHLGLSVLYTFGDGK